MQVRAGTTHRCPRQKPPPDADEAAAAPRLHQRALMRCAETRHPCCGLLSIFQMSLFVWPNSPSRPLILRLLPTATLPRPLPVSLFLFLFLSLLLFFNLAAAKTASCESGTLECRKQPQLNCESIQTVQPDDERRRRSFHFCDLEEKSSINLLIMAVIITQQLHLGFFLHYPVF